MKKYYWITGAVILALLLSGGSFYGGILYQTQRANQLRTNFLASRGSFNNGQENEGGNNPFFANGSGQGGGGLRGAFGGGVTGQVKSLEGNVLQISTPQNVTTVNLSGTTVIQKYAAGAATDLQQGQRVIVSGPRDDQGDITATQIMILPETSVTTPTAP